MQRGKNGERKSAWHAFFIIARTGCSKSCNCRVRNLSHLPGACCRPIYALLTQLEQACPVAAAATALPVCWAATPGRQLLLSAKGSNQAASGA